MRSDMVFEAIRAFQAGFYLPSVSPTRKLHEPNICIQDTTNAVFVRLSRANQITGVRRIPHLTTVPLRRPS